MIRWDSPAVHSLGIILATILLAFLVRFIMEKFLLHIVRKTKTDLDDHFLKVIKKPTFMTVILLGIHLSCYPLNLSPGLLETTERIVKSGIIIFWVFAGMGFGTFFVDWTYKRKDQKLIQLRTKPLFTMILKIAIFMLGGYMVLLTWGKNATALLTSASVVGLVVGFAAKDTLGNLFSGVSIMADAPYKIGDYILLGNGDRGRVTHIGLRSTRILTRDEVEIIIPNAVIANETIINQSGGPSQKFRIRALTSVAYGSDIDQVREILLKVAQDEDLAMNMPKPAVRFSSFGDSGLNFELLCWVEKPELKSPLIDHLNCEIYKKLNDANIEIPYPKTDVYLHKIEPK